jgi:low affinity Fe/Cu permease
MGYRKFCFGYCSDNPYMVILLFTVIFAIISGIIYSFGGQIAGLLCIVLSIFSIIILFIVSYISKTYNLDTSYSQEIVFEKYNQI